MDTASNNPKSNKLGPGVAETDITDAVLRSGYPLQTLVADQLREWFSVEEEWSYVDAEATEPRTIDMLAEVSLWDHRKEQPRVRPELALLVECKRSELPYIFFLTSSPRFIRRFPIVTGLLSEQISITTNDDPSTWDVPILNALGLIEHPFFLAGPEFCHNFSRARRDGKKLNLSGSEAFSNLVLPLSKALEYLEETRRPPISAAYFDSTLAIGLAVLDAPMVGVNVSEKATEAHLIPWVRVLRHKTDEFRTLDEQRGSWHAIDVVHKDFLREYIQIHALPFAVDFATLALRHQKELATSLGFARGMGQNPWMGTGLRLEPRSVKSRVSRLEAAGAGIVRLIARRK